MATIFTITVDPDGTGDWTSLSSADSNTYCDITSAATKVYPISSLTGAVGNNVAVTLYRGGSPVSPATTGTAVRDTATQVLVKNISGAGVPQSGDLWRVDSSNYVTISGAGDSAIVKIKCICTNGTADTTTLILSAWTLSATNYLEFYTDLAYRHNGTYQTGNKYRLEVAMSATINSAFFSNSINYVKVTGLQVKITNSYDYVFGIYTNGWLHDGCEISQCVINQGTVIANNFTGDGIYEEYGTNTNKIHDNIILDFNNLNNTQGNGIEVLSAGAAGAITWNNTMVACHRGFQGLSTDYILYNNLVSVATGGALGDAKANSASRNNVSDAGTTGAILNLMGFGALQASGTANATGGTGNQLVVPSGTGGLQYIRIGSIVRRAASTTIVGYVVSIVNDYTLNLNAAIFDATPRDFSIYYNMYGIPTFLDSANKNYKLSVKDTAARRKAYNLVAAAVITTSSDILNQTRSSNWDVGAHKVNRQHRGVILTN